MARQSHRGNLLDDRTVKLGRRRQVENSHGRDAAAAVEPIDKLLELLITLQPLITSLNIIESLGELLPNRFVLETGARELAYRFTHLLSKLFMAHLAPGVARDGKTLRQALFKREVVKRRNQLPFGEVARCTEDR